MKAMSEYRNARGLTQPVLEWKYLLFNWNDRPATLARAVDMAKAAGLTALQLTPKAAYVDSMVDCNDPLYRGIMKRLPKGKKLGDYVTSLDVSACKRGGKKA